MKILICHNFYQQMGGEQVAVLALKSLLECKGHNIVFYAENNENVKQYNNLQKIGFIQKTIFSQHTYRYIKHLMISERPSIAHVHNVFPLLSPSLYMALNRYRIPIVQTVHNYRLMCINGMFLRNGKICELCKHGKFFSSFRFKCYKESYLLSGLYALTIALHRRIGTFAKIDRFIAPTSFVADKLTESGLTKAEQISVLGNFLPTPLADYGIPEMQDPYVVYIGRLSPEKGILTLLNAIRHMPHLRLKLLGSGPLHALVNEYIRSHRMHNVEMLGFVEGEEKDRILRGALCCVLPSECYETFGLVVLESAAVGTPIVASRLGSLATLVAEGERGLLFTPGDSADLRAKLEHLVGEPDMAIRMGQQARHWVETEYTSEAHYEALMKIYQQVMR